MSLKVICLNLWAGGYIFPTIKEFLKSEKADILLLQEVYTEGDPSLPPNYRSLEVLKKEFSDLPYFSFAPTFTNNLRYSDPQLWKTEVPFITVAHFDKKLIEKVSRHKIKQGNAIFSRFPLKEMSTVFYDVPYNPDYREIPEKFPYVSRNLQHVEITIDNQVFNIFNTQGIWGKDGLDNERRLKMSETIISQIKNKKNVILAGDFNVRPDTQTIGNIEKYLKNVFTDELTTTFNMKRKSNSGYADAVVDLILISPNLKIIDHRCPPVDISDHLPLVAVLEV